LAYSRQEADCMENTAQFDQEVSTGFGPGGATARIGAGAGVAIVRG